MIHSASQKYNLRHNAPLIDIATHDVACLPPEALLGAAAEIMAKKRISSVLIVNPESAPLGIVTERNLLHAMEVGTAPSTPLRDVMSSPVISVPPEMNCLDAYQVCLRDGIRHLAVVGDDNVLLGVVSEADFRLNFNLAALSGRRKVSTAMSRAAFHVSPEETLQSALTMMRLHHDSCVVVVDEKRPVGILTERDIVRLFLLGTDRDHTLVGEVMSSPVLAVKVDQSINEAAECMMSSQIRHLVVVDAQGLVAGVVSEHDLTNSLATSLLDTRQITEEALLNTLVDTLPDLVWVKDIDGVYLACNRRFEQFVGLPEDEVVGRTDYDFVDKEQADFFRMNDRIALEKGAPSINEEWLTFADGHRECLEAIKTPMFDTHGQLIGILGIARDITSRKQAEAEMRVAATAFESLEGILITDAQGNILRVNRAFTHTTGYTPEEVIGRNPRILNSGRQPESFYVAMWDQIACTGVWEGEIWNRRKNGEIYPEHLLINGVKDETGKLTNYVATFTDITKSKADAERIERLAFYDPLTQLPNRRLLIDRLKFAFASCSRHRRHGALLFLDLDHFKNLNDTLGHDVGDLLLQQVAHRLNHCVRENDTVARLGGDEFVILLEELSEQPLEAATQAENIAIKIHLELNAPYDLGAHTYHSSPSIGIALFNEHPAEVEDILKQADIAMYQAKRSGRNTIRFFDPIMQDRINARAVLENELRYALENNELELYYQVQMHASGKVLGAEALMRWHHPKRGLILPSEFIPLAEESGLILPMGQWALEIACKQLEAWGSNSLTRDWNLSLNVSALQFHREGFVDSVRQSLAGRSFPPHRLKLELTESLLLENTDYIIQVMRELRDLGVQFSLDDFGTGYSSLQYLKRLPFNQLKIDQTFVHDIAGDSNDESIVRTIIAMAQGMDLDYIAEGVETEVQQLLLMSHGCTHYQGFLYGMPMPIGAFEADYVAPKQPQGA